MRPIEAIRIEEAGAPRIVLRDPSGESEGTLVVSEATLWILSRLDGSRDLGDLQVEICRSSGEIVPRSTLEELVEQLEEAGFLDSPAFRENRERQAQEYARRSSRPAFLAGKSYPSEAERLGAWIDELLAQGRDRESTTHRALIAPHIDPGRGGRVYGSAYRAIRETSKRRIIILGISHNGGELPYATTCKDYETPLGICKTDREFVDALNRGLPFDPSSEEILHRREHSIEFQVVFLRRVLDSWEDRRIVPILCCYPYLPKDQEAQLGELPSWRSAFSERLAAQIDEDTLIVAGVDFAHVGRRFGDADGSVEDLAKGIEAEDREMMDRIAAGDLAGLRAAFDATRDRRRVCGYPAFVTLLEILPDARGEILDYDQAVDRSIDSLVSFGAILLR
jgi:AmmeMemoRadiSam system protein B